MSLAIFILLACLVIFKIFFAIYKYYKTANNFELIAKLLHTEVRYPILNLPIKRLVEGNYKGREIVCYFNYFCNVDDNIAMYIKPHIKPQKKKLFVLDYDRPTEYTCCDGDKIVYYWRKSSLLECNKKNVYSLRFVQFQEQDIMRFFEELTRAAEIVESKTNT